MLLVEYSIKENAFHIEPLSERLLKNLNLVCKGISKDYQAVGLALNREQAENIISQIKISLLQEFKINAN